MQPLSQTSDVLQNILGRRRGITDLAQFALDLNWVRADSKSTARSESYPSPPMSGSPPLPPKASQETAERRQGVYQATTRDGYRGIAVTHGGEGLQSGTSAHTRPYLPNPPDRMSYEYQRPEPSMTRPHPYDAPRGTTTLQPSFPPITGSGSVGGPIPGPPPHSTALYHSAHDSHPQTSPKPQRKTKGHVASACVPCKRAHLRCDARRPCSRCSSSGKDDACIDVQHKKRGRPRLRDDRADIKYDSTRFGVPSDGMRRPLSSQYHSGPSSILTFDDTLRRTQSYRVLKSQPPDSAMSRFAERGSTHDSNVFLAPLTMSTRPPEPVAYSTVDLQVGKASKTFLDAIGRVSVRGLRLADLVVGHDREKVASIQRQMVDQQRRNEPNYLPPIFGKAEEERVMDMLSFSSEEVSKYPSDRHDILTFLGQDGLPRRLSLRTALSKRDSIYYVVLLLMNPSRQFHYSESSPGIRETTQSYQPYTQGPPVTTDSGPRPPRPADSGYGEGAHGPAAPPLPPSMAGFGANMPSAYISSPSRTEYSNVIPPFQIPRSELISPSRPDPLPAFQLPPIRNHQPNVIQPQEAQYRSREERSRVDIGGLLDHPNPTEHTSR
ncbi:hypothetical protein QBC32DRAFT_207385 [Pseudoneurospora amorphoporcata]|uniref:Zn(2)-C6 fungal-type domain-containing protein n=1 Tax=Pseudoneurospora amorphoporcata TaxID=241081 RepID=A0AAN6SII2_9PEZI|nr:hypothetical protein QBC32DRAFT_207385 [Pseudoneurospora amorphoporcata]